MFTAFSRPVFIPTNASTIRAFSKSSRQHAMSGFTLLELLVVITLLGVISGSVVLAYQGVQEQGREDVTRFEMTEIKKALLQFRRDSGSRDFPGQGLYDCTDKSNGGVVTDANAKMVFPPEAGGTDGEQIAWCQHPANFWMLFQNPLNNNDWNPDTQRGWNGPYLQRKSGFVDVGANLDSNGTGSPLAGAVISNLWGVAGTFVSKPVGDYLVWRPATGENNYAQHATPYLLFDLDQPEQARIVNMAQDNLYQSVDAPNCIQTLDAENNPQDYIVCLLR